MINLELETNQDVTIKPAYGKCVTVVVDSVDIAQIVKQIGVEELLNEIGHDKALDAIGEKEARSHFGLAEE